MTAARGLDPVSVVEAWLEAGVRLIQLRAKIISSGRMLHLADAMAARALDVGATFLVNDRVDVARLSGAAGVHLGQDDLPVADARAILGADAVIGLSTHNDAQVARGREERVDYLAIGPVYSTATKTRPDPVVGLSGVESAVRLARQAQRPIVAIGGITLETAPAVLASGAASVAVISELLAGDPGARARAFLNALA